jgi:hypothetical protein
METLEGDVALHPEVLVDPNHYETIRFALKVANNTAGTTIKEESLIQVIQLLELGFVFELPKGSCSVGHNLLVELLVIRPGGSALYLNSTSRVVKVENIFEDRDRVELKLLQFSEEAWKQIHSLVSERQQEIEIFIDSAKGHA